MQVLKRQCFLLLMVMFIRGFWNRRTKEVFLFDLPLEIIRIKISPSSKRGLGCISLIKRKLRKEAAEEWCQSQA